MRVRDRLSVCIAELFQALDVRSYVSYVLFIKAFR